MVGRRRKEEEEEEGERWRSEERVREEEVAEEVWRREKLVGVVAEAIVDHRKRQRECFERNGFVGLRERVD